MAKVISVWGSPGSGKTTLACAIAAFLSSKKNNVAIVCCNDSVPTIPSIFPQTTKNINEKSIKVKSIGKILSLTDASDNDFLQQFMTINNSGRVVLIGYAYGESSKSYPAPTEYDVYNFYGKLEDMVDYIIIDCMSNLDNKLTSIGLANSDAIVRTCGTSYKDIVYFASNMTYVPSKNVPINNHINVFVDAKTNDAVEDTRGFYGNVNYVIRHDESVKKSMENGELLLSPFPKKFKKTVVDIVEEMNLVG